MADRQLRARIIAALGGAIVGTAVIGGGVALAADHAVDISGFAFAPPQIAVAVGDTVTWTNSDARVHRVIADDASWDAGEVAGGGGKASVTFLEAGAFPYHCSIHPEMTGSVTVEAAAGAPAPATDAEKPTVAEPAPGDEWLAAVVVAMAWVATFILVRRRLAASR